MTAETLTAEERALLENIDGLFGHVGKLLRLYDAALARAEAEAAERSKLEPTRAWLAAESRITELEAQLNTISEAFDRAHDRELAAESRLAAAVELLRRCKDEFNFDEFDDPCQRELQHDVGAFLSTTPAPAAWDIRGKEPVLVPAPAAESEP